MRNRYPRRLLPKHNFDIIPENILNQKLGDSFIIRKIRRNSQSQDYKDLLRNQFMPTTFKNGISVILLNQNHREEDVGWFCRKPFGKTKKYELKWDDNKRKTIYPKNRHLQYMRKKVTFGGYRIREVNNYISDYPVSINMNGSKLVRQDEIHLKVVHEPTCINFWHCEIFIYVVNGNNHEQYYLSNKQVERAGNMILDDLVDMACSSQEVQQFFIKRNYFKAK